MENLVCAELSSGLSFEMLQDNKVLVLNDGGLFAVTTEENAKQYKEDFYPLDAEMRDLFAIVFEGDKVVSKMVQDSGK